ncbi:MAG: type III polyketide synthase [Bradymonadaceae bacterium]|nr:type III polyketide synthase [Lujinxingiaceae bacterium]
MTNVTSSARLYSLSTALPPFTATQEHSLHFMQRVIEASAGPDEVDRALMFLEAIHESCGIERRYSAIEDFTRDNAEDFSFFPKNWALAPVPSTAKRMELFEPVSMALCEEASRKALVGAGVKAGEVTHLIVATCTGLYAPGPDILLVKRLGLGASTRRTVIGFMGCYAAFTGLRMAEQIIAADPEAVVLQVCVELCSLHYQRSFEPQTIIGNCLFGDGCAAAVWAGRDRFEGGLADLVTSHCEISHDSLDQMQWHVGDEGFLMHLDVEVPQTLRRGGAAFIDTLCRRAKIAVSDVQDWAVHPGGPKIVDAVRDAAGLEEHDVAISRSVLRDYGNMSSATALFVLERQLAARRRGGPLVLLGFGPGLTMEGAVMLSTAP